MPNDNREREKRVVISYRGEHRPDVTLYLLKEEHWSTLLKALNDGDTYFFCAYSGAVNLQNVQGVVRVDRHMESRLWKAEEKPRPQIAIPEPPPAPRWWEFWK